jgi:hypothetical protein
LGAAAGLGVRLPRLVGEPQQRLRSMRPPWQLAATSLWGPAPLRRPARSAPSLGRPLRTWPDHRRTAPLAACPFQRASAPPLGHTHRCARCTLADTFIAPMASPTAELRPRPAVVRLPPGLRDRPRPAPRGRSPSAGPAAAALSSPAAPLDRLAERLDERLRETIGLGGPNRCRAPGDAVKVARGRSPINRQRRACLEVVCTSYHE